jgi:outer membrane putative beta-barrel porin/alpha-amylase
LSNRAGLTCALLLAATSACAQPTQADDRIQPDRPDITNSAHLVAPGQFQIELGGLYTRVSPQVTGFGSPALARIGASTWIEARIGGDGWVGRTDGIDRQSGLGNLQAGAKVRLLSDSHGEPILSVLPLINLPTANPSKGLGSGDMDYTVTLAAGVDVGARGHVDANYGIGKIGAGGSQPHFTQYLMSVSASVSAERWDPYGEVFWFSRQEPGRSAVAAFDVGTICHLRDRLAIDAGLQIGLSRSAPNLTVFGGLSVGFKHSEH